MLQIRVCNIQPNEETSFSHFGPDLKSLRGVFLANRCTKTITAGSKGAWCSVKDPFNQGVEYV